MFNVGGRSVRFVVGLPVDLQRRVPAIDGLVTSEGVRGRPMAVLLL